MTSTSSPPTTSRLDQRLAWARRTLDVADDASWDEVRRRMLQLVTDEGFVPPQAMMQAFRTLEAEERGIAELDDPPAFVRQQEAELQEAAGNLAEGMFRLPPAERKAKWQRLMAQAEHVPRARAWVERLAQGLPVDFGVLNTKSQPAQQLGRYLGELFVLRPAARAERRAEILAGLKDKWAQWELAAWQIQQQHPEIAALDPPLLGRLVAPRPVGTGAKVQLPQPRPASGGWSEMRWLWVIAVMVVLVTSRALISDRPRPPVNRPIYAPPSELSSEQARELMERIEGALKRPASPPAPLTRPTEGNPFTPAETPLGPPRTQPFPPGHLP